MPWQRARIGDMKDEPPARIVVRVQPNASQSEVRYFQEGVWHIRIAAPPVKGEANQELVQFLGKILGLSQSSLTIEKGMTRKIKAISVAKLTPDQLTRQLEKDGE